MEFEEVLNKRRSIRIFLSKKVPDNILNKILGAAVKAPTNCNTQLWNFIVVKDKNIIEKLIKKAASNTMIGRAPILIVPTHDNAIGVEGVQSIMMAIQNMLLEATNLGLGSICINSIGSPKKIKEILNIPKSETICSFVLVGYAKNKDKDAFPIPRRKITEVVHYNKFDRKRKKIFLHNPNSWTIEQISDYQRFFSRKTFLGKEMDIRGIEEKELIGKILSKEQGPFLDLFSYDGSYLHQFPKRGKIFSLDLSDQPLIYTETAVKLSCPELLQNLQQDLYLPNFDNKLNKIFRTITLLYKAERLPSSELKAILKKSKSLLEKDGKLIIVSRTSFSLFGAIYLIIRLIFDNDIRKTGIFAYFGPYKPISPKKILKLLVDEGYKSSKTQFFIIPPILDMIYQMYMQYKKSEGTSFLFRLRRENFMSQVIKKLISMQGFNKFKFGSVAVITATKK